MSGDFNEKDSLYEFIASPQMDNTFNLLNKDTKMFYQKVENEIFKQYSENEQLKTKLLKLDYSILKNNFSLIKQYNQYVVFNKKLNFYFYKKRYISNIDSCLNCLNSFMYQVKKIKIHNEELKTIIPPKDNSPTVIAKSSLEACSDFESLLFQARATLDRLTFFICKQIYKNQFEQFNKRIINILKNYEKKDSRSSEAISIFNSSIAIFQGLLIDKEKGGTSLRSLLAHSKSHSEAINGEFTVHRSQDYILRFDQELDEYPLLNSSYILNKYVVYTILNILAIYLDMETRLVEDNCIPNWKPCAIKASQFKVEKDYPDSIPFTIPLFIPIGFIPDTYYFKKEILQYVDIV